MNVQESASSDSTGDIGVGQDKAILWQEYPNLYWTRKLFDFFFFLLVKLGQYFY